METSGFVHSEKVPRLYKSAALIARRVRECGESLKSLVYNSRSSRFQNIKGQYSLIVKTLEKFDTLEVLLQKSGLLEKEKRLDPWLARILISELLWGKKKIPGFSKPVLAVMGYHTQFVKILDDEAIGEKFEVKKPIYIRVNTLMLRVQDVIDQFIEEGWNLIPTPEKYKDYLKEIKKLDESNFIKDWHISEVFAFPPKSCLSNHHLHVNGSIVIQDKSSCFVTHLLSPPPGSIILDMCAAPGLKTAHCAAAMRNKGKIYAVEMNKERHEVLCETVDRLGITCVQTIHSDALKLETNSLEDVEIVLVDVPCTGSGMVNRYDYGQEGKDLEARLESLHGLQCMLLKYAMTNFPSAKKVVYSTCSVHEEENESVISDVLASKISQFYELSDCVSQANNSIRCGKGNYDFSKQCLRFRPKRDMTNGFFLAVFERKQEDIVLTSDDCNEGLQLNDENENKSVVNIQLSETTSHLKLSKKREICLNENITSSLDSADCCKIEKRKGETAQSGENDLGITSKKKKKKRMRKDAELLIDNSHAHVLGKSQENNEED